MAAVSEPVLSVSAEDASLADVVRRAEHGETIAVIAHGEHVADIVPSGELERLRETIEVLADRDAMRDLDDDEIAVRGVDAIRAMVAERAAREGR